MFDFHNLSGFLRNLRFKNDFVIEFTRDLSLLLKAGLMIIESLQLIAQQTADKFEKTLIDDLITQLRNGHNFSDCLKQYPQLFNQVYCSLIEVGELTGHLGEMLNSNMEYLEKIARFRKKFIQVLTYPVFVMVAAFLALIFMIFFVIPAFNDLFRDFNSELPLLTRIILSMSAIIQKNIICIIIVCIISIFLLFQIKKIEHFKYFIHKRMLLLPFCGAVIRKKHIFRFCRTLGTLLSGGVNLIHSLDMMHRSISNFYFKKEILVIKDAISQGEKLSDTMLTSFLFPPLVLQMILVGEESGELSEVLLKIAFFYEKDIDHTIEVLAEIIEPILILFLGLIIGLILVAIYLPLFNMTRLFPG